MIRAGSSSGEMTVSTIAAKYGVPAMTVHGWVADWPHVRRIGRTYVYDEQMADDWVRQHAPAIWAALEGNDLDLPAGEDDDLLNYEEFGEIYGIALRGKPVSASGLRSQKSRGYLPAPDRTPDDDKTPAVEELKWYRRTVYEHIRSRRRRRAASR